MTRTLDAHTVLSALQGLAAAVHPPPSRSPLPEVALTFEALGGGPFGWRVLRASAREAMSTLYECQIDLAADDPLAEPGELLGAPASFTLRRAAVSRRFGGLVRRVEDLGTAAGHRLARVLVVPALWSLSQRMDTRVFQDMTVPAIVAAVLRGAGLYPGRLDLRLRGTAPEREYCVQHGETDLAFVQRLLEDEGIAYHFEAGDGGERLVLADHPGAYAAIATLDGGAVHVAGPEGATAAVETARHFDFVTGLHATGVTVRDQDFTRPALDLTRQSPRGGSGARAVYHAAPDAVLHGYQRGAYGADNVQRQADLRAEALAAEARVGRAVTSLVGARAGGTFTLAGHGRADLDGCYLIVRVEHHAEAPDALPHAVRVEGEGPSERYRNAVECVPAGLPWRPARETPRPVVAGLQSATVVGPAGEEVYTDVHGRVRVRFHWDRGAGPDEARSCWIRVLQPWAGAGWGAMFLPRVGMEVVVDFLEGNPDRPVVLGCLYNGQHPPPYTLPEERTRSGLRTRSTPEGVGANELGFEDAAGAERLYLHAQRDLEVVARRDRTAVVRRDQSTAVDRDLSEHVAGDRSRRVTGREDIAVGGERTVTVGADSALTVDGDQRVRVRGQDACAVEHGRTVEVTGGDALRVTSGGRDVTVDAGGDRLGVTGDRHEKVTGTWAAVADGGYRLHQGETALVLEGGHAALRARGQVHVGNPSGQVTFGAADGVLTLEARGEIRLRCGSASLVLSADGRVTLRGTHAVTLSSGESALALDPEGATLSGPRVTSQALGVHEIAGALIRIG